MRQLLSKPRKIAVLGASPDEGRPSNQITRFLINQGHDVIPVNPMAPAVAGVACAKDLPGAVERWGSPPDVVDVFRSPHHLPAIVPDVIASKASWLWLQLGVVHDESVAKALDAGLEVVADRCILVEARRLV